LVRVDWEGARGELRTMIFLARLRGRFEVSLLLAVSVFLTTFSFFSRWFAVGSVHSSALRRYRLGVRV
jgi:hypothetical protein